MTYGLTITHGRERADPIASKAKEALDALFVEYFTMLGANIPKFIPAKPSIRVDIGKKCRKGWLET